MIVYLFIGSIDAIGVIWVLAILYFISTFQLTLLNAKTYANDEYTA